MNRNSSEVLKQAIGLKTKEITHSLGVGKDLVMQWKNGNAKNDIDRVIQLYNETEDIDIIKYICVHADGYFVRNDNKGIKKGRVNKIISKFTETIKVINEANEDNHIDIDELFKIIGIGNEAKAELDAMTTELMKHFALEHNVVLSD